MKINIKKEDKGVWLNSSYIYHISFENDYNKPESPLSKIIFGVALRENLQESVRKIENYYSGTQVRLSVNLNKDKLIIQKNKLDEKISLNLQELSTLKVLNFVVENFELVQSQIHERVHEDITKKQYREDTEEKQETITDQYKEIVAKSKQIRQLIELVSKLNAEKENPSEDIKLFTDLILENGVEEFSGYCHPFGFPNFLSFINK